MSEQVQRRRLAAILAADVVGYSRLMQADEAGTLAALKARRGEILQPLVSRHRGRIVKLMSDGVLVEFASAVNAVACAVQLQDAMASANASLPEEKRIVLRIGINLGDVMVEGGDLYGDGVNVAARLEALAEPGAVVISANLHDQLQGKLDVEFVDLGEQLLKNMTRPVRAYRVTSTARTAGESPRAANADGQPLLSIAVLPFNNMSGDPEQEYFSDGITEDLMTELSRFKDLLVIARNSCFLFKGTAVDVKEAGRKLGARYIVEGSVRKSGKRARITAQLIDAATGNHLWAERYDRDLEDIFVVQDEVVRAISGAIPGRLNRVAVEHLRRKPPGNLTAYDCELRGRWAYFHLAEGIPIALEWYKKAVEADPDYALALAGLAMTSVFGVLAVGLPGEATIASSREHARRAVMLDGANPVVNACAAFTYHIAGDHKLARSLAQRAVSLNPNDPFVLYAMGCALSYTGDPEAALDWFARSERLEPYAVDDQRLDTLCDTRYMLRDYRRVIEIHETYQNAPAFLYIVLAAAHAQLGQTAEAHASMRKYEGLKPPGHDIKTHIKFWMRMCSRPEDVDNWLDGFRKAGIDV
jgi:adenylate cyclase